jgi:hypothetical protein
MIKNAAQMRLLRLLLGFTRLDCQRNHNIHNRLKVNNKIEDIKLYERSWLDHLERMDRSRSHKLALQYQPWGQQNAGRPRERWKDQEQFEL